MANAGFDTEYPTPIKIRPQEIIGQIVLYTLDKLSYNRFQKTGDDDMADKANSETVERVARAICATQILFGYIERAGSGLYGEDQQSFEAFKAEVEDGWRGFVPSALAAVQALGYRVQ